MNSRHTPAAAGAFPAKQEDTVRQGKGCAGVATHNTSQGQIPALAWAIFRAGVARRGYLVGEALGDSVEEEGGVSRAVGRRRHRLVVVGGVRQLETTARA